MKKNEFYGLCLGIIVILSLGFGFTWDVMFPGDFMQNHYSGEYFSHEFGGLHTVFNIVSIVVLLISFIITVIDWLDDGIIYKKNIKEHYENLEKSKTTKLKFFTVKKGIVLLIVSYLLILLFNLGKGVFKDSSTMYNKSIVYKYALNSKNQEKAGFYDKMWTTYGEKLKISNMNKDMFIQITKIIMENRADGKNLAWKWLQENQNIPFEQFTVFYTDLTDYITTQREGYYIIEKECIKIANENNAMLDTFPNNLYNKFIGCPKLNAEYGFLSVKTIETFKTKTEK